MGNGYIATFGQHMSTKIKCGVVNVYAEYNLNVKTILWETLSNLKLVHQDLTWCFYGDFNVVRSVNERTNAREKGDQLKDISGFNGFIDKNLWMELSVVGKKYTWFKSNGC